MGIPALSTAPRMTARAALHRAAQAQDVEQVKKLIADGADVNRADGDLFTPLHCACDLGDPRVAALLLEARADPDASHPGLDGWTPLHVAAWRGSAECVSLLLRHGADAGALDWYGRAPVDWAPVGGPAAELLATDACAAAGSSGRTLNEDRFASLRGKGSTQVSEVHLANIERSMRAAETHGAKQAEVVGAFDPKCKL